jgi:membrane AbrB-like protein
MTRADAETLAAAALGALVFVFLGLPAPAISGAMVGCAGLLALGRKTAMHPVLRDMGMLTGGITMGSAVTPEMIGAIYRYPASLIMLVASILATIGLTQLFLRRMGGLDRFTAFFASAPGALSSVLAVAAETRANLLQVTIIQSFRLFVLVAILPSIVVASCRCAPSPGRLNCLPCSVAAPCWPTAWHVQAWPRRGYLAEWLFQPSCMAPALLWARHRAG